MSFLFIIYDKWGLIESETNKRSEEICQIMLNG